MVGTAPDSVASLAVGSVAQNGCHSFVLALSQAMVLVRVVVLMPLSLLLMYWLSLLLPNAMAAGAALQPQSPRPPRSMICSPCGPVVRVGMSAGVVFAVALFPLLVLSRLSVVVLSVSFSSVVRLAVGSLVSIGVGFAVVCLLFAPMGVTHSVSWRLDEVCVGLVARH